MSTTLPGVNAAGQKDSARGAGEFRKAKCVLTREYEAIRGCRTCVGNPTSSSNFSPQPNQVLSEKSRERCKKTSTVVDLGEGHKYLPATPRPDWVTHLISHIEQKP